jgi:spore coat polysaccharide biosynthesis predicted glycosyltransferase SpsG
VITPDILCFGDLVNGNPDNDGLDVVQYPLGSDFCEVVENAVTENKYGVVLFDLFEQVNLGEIGNLLQQLKKRGTHLISIDCILNYGKNLDLIWVPSFYLSGFATDNSKEKIRFGWDTYLLDKRLDLKVWEPGKNILVLTGGSDTTNLNLTLPVTLEKFLNGVNNIHWVQGPFSGPPKIPKSASQNWSVHKSPKGLDNLFVNSNYVLTVYGVSFFEALQYGIPCVVFSPYGCKDKKELNLLKEENVAYVADDIQRAVCGLNVLMEDHKISQSYLKIALKKLSKSGCKNLASEIYKLVNN